MWRQTQRYLPRCGLLTINVQPMGVYNPHFTTNEKVVRDSFRYGFGRSLSQASVVSEGTRLFVVLWRQQSTYANNLVIESIVHLLAQTAAILTDDSGVLRSSARSTVGLLHRA